MLSSKNHKRNEGAFVPGRLTVVRAYLPAMVVVCAGLAGAAAAAQQSRPLVPTGGMWQSIPSTSDAAEPPEASALPRVETKATVSAKPAAPKLHPVRHPVAAAATSEKAPEATAAARTRELERRLDILSPGTRLGEAITDPENPSW